MVSTPFLFWRIKSKLTHSAEDSAHHAEEGKRQSFLDTNLMKSIARALGMNEEERAMHALLRFILLCHEDGTPKYTRFLSSSYLVHWMQPTRNIWHLEIPAFAEKLECKSSLLVP